MKNANAGLKAHIALRMRCSGSASPQRPLIAECTAWTWGSYKVQVRSTSRLGVGKGASMYVDPIREVDMYSKSDVSRVRYRVWCDGVICNTSLYMYAKFYSRPLPTSPWSMYGCTALLVSNLFGATRISPFFFPFCFDPWRPRLHHPRSVLSSESSPSSPCLTACIFLF